MAEYLLDAKRLLCPLPVIKTQNKIKQLNAGDELTVVCTDPGALQDIPAWCRIFGHQIISMQDNEDEISITIKVIAEI